MPSELVEIELDRVIDGHGSVAYSAEPDPLSAP
jgi:hypothetical protein